MNWSDGGGDALRVVAVGFVRTAFAYHYCEPVLALGDVVVRTGSLLDDGLGRGRMASAERVPMNIGPAACTRPNEAASSNAERARSAKEGAALSGVTSEPRCQLKE
jgi:hypothetical protein